MAYVYLIADSEKDYNYKIGVTKGSLEKRIKKLQTGNSGELFVVKSFETNKPFYIEKQLHRHFATKKVLNEWFELSDEDVEGFIDTCEMFEGFVDILKDNPFFKV